MKQNFSFRVGKGTRKFLLVGLISVNYGLGCVIIAKNERKIMIFKLFSLAEGFFVPFCVVNWRIFITFAAEKLILNNDNNGLRTMVFLVDWVLADSCFPDRKVAVCAKHAPSSSVADELSIR